MTRCFLMSVMLLPLATIAHAETLHLSWDACGSEGTYAKSFACDSNTGSSFSLYCSFVAPAGTTEVTGAEITLDLMSCAAMPDWWQFRNSGTCRRTALSSSADFTAMESAVCVDMWQGLAVGGLVDYTSWTDISIGRARITASFAREPAFVDSLEAGREYAAAKVVISPTGTTGLGSCTGCTRPVLLWLSQVRLIQPPGVGNFRMLDSGYGSYAAWQTTTGPSFFCGDPVRNSTWGAIKAQYR